MKKLLILSCTVLICTVMICVSSAASLSPALDNIADSYSLTVSALKGESVSFEKSTFTALQKDGKEICIVSLPEESEGKLYYKDGAVTVGQIISYDNIENLSFVPCDKTEKTDFGFTFDGSYNVTCAIVYSDKVNSAPTVGTTPTLNTHTKASCSSSLRATDKDGDSLTYEITKHPANGKLTFDKKTGDFTYTASDKSGVETFTYKVTDENGASSKTATVSINVTKPQTTLNFSDVDRAECFSTAATVMADKGIMTYNEAEGKNTFEPDKTVSRLEFLVSTMEAFGADNLPEVSNTGFDDSESVPEKYLSYVYSAKELGIINGINKNGKTVFDPDSEITVAQAAQIINNIMGHEAKDECAYTDTVPTWAKSAVDAAYDLGIINTEKGAVGANATVTRAQSAEMLFRLCGIIYE